MVHVIQLQLPLCGHDQPATPAKDLHAIVKAELTRHFGRCTAHTVSPVPVEARAGAGTPAKRNEIVIYEVMSALLDAQWWSWYQKALEARFRKVEVIIRELPLICL